ncbi:MAG: D-glycerate dehydrogenase [Rhodospirillaceae bacterium]|nr:D-glycerate dehydrogenase [Rhodospirillaceae bacterium]
MKKSVFLHSWAPDDVLADLKEHFDVDQVNIFETGSLDRETFNRHVAGKDGILVQQNRVDAEMLAEHAGKLQVVANVAVGVDNIDVEAATKHGIQITNTPDVLTEAVADMSMALTLAVARRVVEADRYTRAGKFQGNPFPLFWGADITGETFGIVGMGRIGQALARRAKGFGLDILYHKRTRLDAATEKELGATWASLDDLLKKARFIVLLTPLTPETKHLITARELGLMREDAYLVNISRGPVVEEAALVDALKAKRIAGAALDVFEFEPKFSDELPKLDNVVLTPHIGSASSGTRAGMVRLAAKNLKAALLGEAVPSPVNKV